MMASVLDKSARAFAATTRASASFASAAMRAARSTRIIACAAAMSEGSDSEACVTRRWNHIRQRPQAKTVSRPMSDAKSVVNGANRFRTEGSQVARPRSRSRHRQGSATKNDPAPIFSRTGMPLARHARSPSKDRLCVHESRRDDRSADHDGEPLGPAATGSRSLSSYPCGPSPATHATRNGNHRAPDRVSRTKRRACASTSLSTRMRRLPPCSISMIPLRPPRLCSPDGAGGEDDSCDGAANEGAISTGINFCSSADDREHSSLRYRNSWLA